jgi:hypothetical protein
MPLFQMLSCAQNNAILYWLFEIIRIGSTVKTNFPLPREVVCDFDKALMGAVVRSFGQCKDLKDYLTKCFYALTGKPQNLPPCFLRLDISHFVHMISRWKALKVVHPRVKTFYILTMGLLSKTTDFDEFKELAKATITLCTSEGCGSDDTNEITLAENASILIRSKIKGISLTPINLEDLTMTNNNLPEVAEDITEDIETSSIFIWSNSFYNECIQQAKNARSGKEINPYYCPDVAVHLKKLLPYFPLFSGVLVPIFGFGKINASSSPVESEFNDLKHRLLKGENRPMRIQKFVSKHLRSFCGRAKLAMANNTNCIKEDSNCIKQTSPNSVVSETEFTLPVNVFDNNITDKSFNGSDDSKKLHDLNAEHNWRNKNAPQKMKRSYLETYPDWDIPAFSKKKTAIDVLKNGSMCSYVQMEKCKIIVKNTCGFDSITHIFAGACTNESYRNFIKSSNSDESKFISCFLDVGPNKDIYKLRATILEKVKYFHQEQTVPEVLVLNAASNISNLCEWVFPSFISYTDTVSCTTCKTEKIFNKVILPINENIVKSHGYNKLKEAILEGKPQTKCCKRNTTISTRYGMQLLIECPIIDNLNKIQLKNIPYSLNIFEESFTLAGVVEYRGSKDLNEVGHYVAYVR